MALISVSRLVFSFAVLASLALAPSANSAEPVLPLKILRIIPSGEDVSPGRQIVLQFSRPVVPLGRMERSPEEIPIKITPALDCQWRWLNASALACQLGEKGGMRFSTRYRMEIQPGIKAEDGTAIAREKIHAFITRRPTVSYSRPSYWRSPGTPVIRITFNQSVSKESVERHIFILKKNDKSKRYQLKVEPDPNDRIKPRFIPVPGESYSLDFGEQEAEKSDDPREVDGREARRVWLAYPEEELPLDTRVTLNIEPGLVSALGSEPGVTGRVINSFDTFPEFKFLGVRCTGSKKGRVLITPENFSNPDMRCNPLRGAALSFTSPIMISKIKNFVEFAPDLAGGRKDYDPWANSYDYSRLRGYHRKDRSYDIYLPELLKAAHKYQIKNKAGASDREDGFRDEFGRALANPIDLVFFTGHRSPDFQLVHKTAVLEKQVDTKIPLYVTNLDEITIQYRSLTAHEKKVKQSATVKIAEAEDISFPVPLGVRDILKGKSGAIYGSITTRPKVAKQRYQRTFFAQVTPFQVHVKLGHFNSLVWVADLETGQGVAGARVIIYKDSPASLSQPGKILSEAVTDANGVALLDGTETLDPDLKTFRSGWHNDKAPRLFVRVDKEDDMVLMPLDDRRFSVQTYNHSGYTVYPWTKKRHGHIHVWGATAQGVYRAGDAIQYKFYARGQDKDTFVAAPQNGYTLKIIDPMGKTVEEIKKLDLSEFGAYDGEFAIPKNGAVGWYSFRLSAGFTKYTWTPISVLVSEFTASPFRVENELNGQTFHPGDKVVISTSAKLHSGGPYTGASTRVTARLIEQPFASNHPIAKGFAFRAPRPYSRNTYTVYSQTEPMNDKGELTSSFELTGQNVLYGSLLAESAVQDDRGKFIAASAKSRYSAVNRFVGLKSPKWLYHEDQTAAIHYLGVDDAGNPVKDTPVEIKIEHLVTCASRVKSAGNVYKTEYADEWLAAGKCAGQPGETYSVCEFIPEDPGSYRLTANISDALGRPHRSQIRVWVVGKGRIVWHEPDGGNPCVGGWRQHGKQNPRHII